MVQWLADGGKPDGLVDGTGWYQHVEASLSAHDREVVSHILQEGTGRASPNRCRPSAWSRFVKCPKRGVASSAPVTTVASDPTNPRTRSPRTTTAQVTARTSHRGRIGSSLAASGTFAVFPRLVHLCLEGRAGSEADWKRSTAAPCVRLGPSTTRSV